MILSASRGDDGGRLQRVRVSAPSLRCAAVESWPRPLRGASDGSRSAAEGLTSLPFIRDDDVVYARGDGRKELFSGDLLRGVHELSG